jgi:hypothetical protein
MKTIQALTIGWLAAACQALHRLMREWAVAEQSKPMPRWWR